MGKSSLAHAISTYLGLPWISTDQIRDVMRSATNQKDTPGLFRFAGYTPETFLAKYTPQQTADREYAQSIETWSGIKNFIDVDYTWSNGFIIEGIAILPHLVAGDFRNDGRVKAVFIDDEDEDRMKQVVYTRGIWTHAKDYSDEAKEKEVLWAKIFSQKIQTEAEKYGYPCVAVEKNETDVAKVLKALRLD